MEILMNRNCKSTSSPAPQSNLEHLLPPNLQQHQYGPSFSSSKTNYESFNAEFQCKTAQGFDDFHCSIGCSGQETPYDCCKCEESYFQQMSCVDMDDFGKDTTLLEYEYKEPDENFISIDDTKVKNFLFTLVEKQKHEEKKKQQLLDSQTIQPQKVLAVIDLEDDDEDSNNETDTKEQLTYTTQDDNSIEPIVNEDIEQVDLLDSSSESNDEDVNDNDIPLKVAASVSCELDCDSGEIEGFQIEKETDEEDLYHDVDFVDENEEGVEVRWDELETSERQTYECNVCGKKVLTSYNLRRHMMIHTGERPYGCDLCHRRFREFSDLKKHRRRHSQEKNFKCMICRVNVPSVKDATRCISCSKKRWLTQIRNSMSPEKPHTPSTIKDKIVTSKVVIPSCSTISDSNSPPRFSSSSSSTSPSPALQKINTQLLLDSVEAVRRPVVNEIGVFTKKEYPCPLCNRPFGTKHNLKRHFMIHTGEKPFSCSTCRKPFREYSTLKKHLQTHVRGRWYKCAHCIEKFIDYIEYSKHKKTHPKDENIVTGQIAQRNKRQDSCDSNDSSIEDSLECYECGQKFTDIELYTNHLKEHDPTMFVFECYVCKETFDEREQLLDHLTKHELNGEVESASK